MVDPKNITNYEASDYELQEVMLFWICAAGKNGTTAARCLDNLLNEINPQRELPFRVLRRLTIETISFLLKKHGIGCYNQKARTIFDLVQRDPNLRSCDPSLLETIWGIGLKTSRCFILHSRPGAKIAGLDTHVLKFLGTKGFDVPKSTPTNKKKYMELEQAFIEIAEKEGKTPAALDLEIWNTYSAG